MAENDTCWLMILFVSILVVTGFCITIAVGGLLSIIYFVDPANVAPISPFQQLILSQFNQTFTAKVTNLDTNTFSMSISDTKTVVVTILHAVDLEKEQQLFNAIPGVETFAVDPTCCLSSGVYLPYDRPFLIHSNGYPSTTALSAVTSAVNTWENVIPSTSIFGNYNIDLVTAPSNDAIISNTANQIIFNRVYASGFEDVLAITRRTFNSQYITQWDIWINSATYQIGDVTQTHVGRMYDLQSLVLHELGHTLGLNDLTAGTCSYAIMYGYLQSETLKRSVDTNSKYCLVDLYPDSTYLKSLLDQYGSNLNVAIASKLYSFFVLN